MAYDVFEASVEAGRPIELYTFTIGAEVFRYTSAEDVVSYSSNDYQPRPMDRNSPTLSSSENGRQQLELTLPKDDPISQRYIAIVPATRVELEVLRFHRDDSPNGFILWQGRITSARFENQGTVCRLFSVSSEAALTRPTPGRKFQGLCNFVLYDGFCQVVKANFKHTDDVVAESGREITVNGILSAKGASWAVGGTIEVGSEKRLIVAQSGDDLTLQIAFPESLIGVEVSVYAGCDHTLATCNSKFSNADRHGGFPFVPKRDPAKGGL